jgi:hypothetical protein
MFRPHCWAIIRSQRIPILIVIIYELMFAARGCENQQGIQFSMVVSWCRGQRAGKEVKQFGDGSGAAAYDSSFV